MDRRTVIAGAAALPLLPAAALAEGADPVIARYREWCAALTAFNEALVGGDDTTPLAKAADDREWAARFAISDTVATTPEGLVCQIRFAFAVFGSPRTGGDASSPDDYSFSYWVDDHDGRLLRSMLAGAERMAEVSS